MLDAAKKQLKNPGPKTRHDIFRPRPLHRKPLVNDTLKTLATRLLPRALKLLFSTLRFEQEPAGMQLPGTGNGIIFAFWHGKMASGWLMAQRLFPGAEHSAVASSSKDGEIAAHALGRFGFRLIRGSSSNGREEVRSGMLSALRNGGVVAVTPDGPRGPRHRFKYGTIRLASEHRIPMLFADIRYERAIALKSWDRFEVPMPFSRVSVRLHLLEIPGFSSEDELRDYANVLSERFDHA